MLQLDKLKDKIPQKVAVQLPQLFSVYNVNTPLRAAHFLAQIAHESGEFTIMTENMNYTTPSRIVEIWPTRFNLTGTNNKKNANEYAKNPQKLAEAVYTGRMGNNEPGDGFRFRGGGYLQLTGKDAYKGYANYIKKDVGVTADLIRSEVFYALDAALWEYTINMKLNPVADQGATDEVVKQITRRVNGGYIGLQDRISKFKKYHTILA